MRDGRDVIASMIERGLTLEEATKRWILSIKRVQDLEKKSGVNLLEIRYENLVYWPVETLKLICAFIGISFNESMLYYWKSPTTIEYKHFDYHRNLEKPVFTTLSDSNVGARLPGPKGANCLRIL